MQISWFEIIAQIINFFIILFILQKLLYKPVVKVMAERQERIQKSQIEADKKMEDAKELIREYDEKIADIDNEKREILDSAREQAHERKETLLETYKEEAEDKRKAYLNEIQDEKELFINNLRKKLGTNAVRIASHILTSISSKELEDEIFNTFISNIKNLHEDIPNPELLDEERHIDLYSSKELPEDKREKIQVVLKEQIGGLEDINYQVDESLISGYQLSLETYTIHTDIKNFLNKIEKDIIDEIETN